MKKLWFILLFTTEVNAATIVVNTTEFLLPASDDGFCTMHEAVAAANDNMSSGVTVGECAAGEVMPTVDVIEFSASILPVNISLANPLVLNESVEIRGPGRGLLSFTSQLGTRVFYIQNTANFVDFIISDISLINNVLDPNIHTDGGAISALISADTHLQLKRVLFDSNHADDGGGAISLAGLPTNNNQVTISDCQFSNNSAESNLETVFGGGAISIGGSLNVMIEGSTFFDNRAQNFDLANEIVSGGAILIRSNASFPTTVTIRNSTMTNNMTTGFGGAVAIGGLSSVIDGSTVNISHSSITMNEANINSKNLGVSGSGGGVFTSSSVDTNLLNTIVANNADFGAQSGPDITGDFNTLGYNFIGDNSTVTAEFPQGQPNLDFDIVGDSIAPLNPLLSSLADNGGPTLTQMPMSNSPVIDHGKCDTENTDQRKFHNLNTTTRIFDDLTITNSLNGCDIGAVERGANSKNPIPEANDDNYQILEGQSLQRSAANGLLSNDNDNNPLVILDPHSFDFISSNIEGIGLLGIYGNIQFVSNDVDANGQAQFDYNVTDQINTATATMSLTILPVNDAPSFSTSTLTFNSPVEEPQSFPSWATDISIGPANENTQTAVFMISSVPANGFFSTGPNVDSNSGDLSFTLLSGASGTAEVTILLEDSGGTSNGGENQSSAVMLTVNAVDSVIFKNGFE